jgi:prohibitin 2
MAAFLRNLRNIKLPGGPNAATNVVKAVVGLSAVGYGAYESVYTVEGGHRAVVYSRITGVGEKVFGEGLHFKLPWFDRPIIYDIRTRPHQMQSLTGTRDLQMVNITLRVLSRPSIDNLAKIYKNLGMDYNERVLPSIVNEVLKQVVARYTAAQLLTMREQVSSTVRANLLERSSEFFIRLEDVSIVDLTFGAEFMRSVEAKQVAQQEAERAKFIVQEAVQQKKSTIIRAAGEAKSIQLIGESVAANPAYIELRKLETARQIAHTVSRSANRAYLSADSLLLNIASESGIQDRLSKEALRTKK